MNGGAPYISKNKYLNITIILVILIVLIIFCICLILILIYFDKIFPEEIF